MNSLFRILSSAIAALTALTGAISTAASATPPPTACTGVSACHQVARTDVNGDGRIDQVGWRQLSDNAVQIRVRLAGGALLVRPVGVKLWFGGGAWGGAARVDDKPGTELLIGSEQGAHTPMYTMLTYRAGALVVEVSPSSYGNKWMVDAAYGDYMGWTRNVSPNGAVTMTERVVFRVGTTNRFTGTAVTYARTTSGWAQASSRPTSYQTVKAAAAMSGFHVSGLQRFPAFG